MFADGDGDGDEGGGRNMTKPLGEVGGKTPVKAQVGY